MLLFISIHVTTPNQSTAKRIGEFLVKENLVACAQIEGPILSIYDWKSKLEKEEEWRLVLKTVNSNYNLVEKKVLELHPYDVPQIISFEIKEGFEQYLQWIQSINS